MNSRQPLRAVLASVAILLAVLALATASTFDYSVQQIATFQRANSNITRFFDVQTADFNNDGSLDILLSFQRTPSNRFFLAVWYGSVSGFIPSNIVNIYDSESPFGAFASEIGVTDLDGDLDLDLIWLTESRPQRLEYALQNSSSRAWSVTTRPETINGTVIVPCDIDRNGKMDFVLTNDEETMVEMYYNEHNGNSSVLLRRSASQFTSGPPAVINCFSRSEWNRSILIGEDFGDIFAVNLPGGGLALPRTGYLAPTLAIKRPIIYLSEGTGQALFSLLTSDGDRVAGAFRLKPSGGVDTYSAAPQAGLFLQSSLSSLGYGTLNTLEAVESFGAATHQMALVVSTSGQLSQPAMILLYDTETASTQVVLNSPNAIFLGKSPRVVNGTNELVAISSNSSHYSFNLISVGPDPVLTKTYSWIDTASTFTIPLVGRNLAPFRGNISSLTVRWRPDTSRAVNATCNTASLVGCPAASWSADGTVLNCTFLASNENCVIQAQVEIDHGGRIAQSRWVTIGWIAPNPAKVLALPITSQGYFNPITVFIPMANTPQTWPGHVESLDFRLAGACSGNFIHECNSTFVSGSPIGFSCRIRMNATFLQSRCPVVAVTTSRGVTNDPVLITEVLIPNFAITATPKVGPGNNGTLITVDGTFLWYPFVPGSINVTFELISVSPLASVSPCETPGFLATYTRPSGSPQLFSFTLPYTRNCRLVAKAVYSDTYQPNATALLATEYAPSFPLAVIHGSSASSIMASVKAMSPMWRFWTEFLDLVVYFGFRCPGEAAVSLAATLPVDGTCVSYDGNFINFGFNSFAHSFFQMCASVSDSLLPTVGTRDTCLLHWAYSPSAPATWHPIARVATFHTVNTSSTRFKFDASVTVNATGVSLPREGETANATAIMSCGSDTISFPCTIVSVSPLGRWIQCRFSPNDSVTDLCSTGLSVTRFTYTAPTVIIGTIIYPPNITDVGPARLVYPGEGSFTVSLSGRFFPNVTESPIISLTLEDVGCTTPPSLSVSGLVLPASGALQSLTFSFDQNVFDSSHHMCSVIVTVSRFGFSTKSFLTRVVSRAPILDAAPLRGISVVSNSVNITGADLPLPEDRTTVVISSPNCPSVPFSCNLSIPQAASGWILCNNLVRQGDESIANGCEIVLSIARGPFRSSNTSVGVLVAPSTIEPVDPYEASFAPPTLIASVSGTNMPLSSGNALATLVMDGPYCGNKTSLVGTTTPLNSTFLTISASIDESLDSCFVNLTLSQFGLPIAPSSIVGRIVAPISISPAIESIVLLQRQTYALNVSGTNLPRDPNEAYQLLLASQNCSSTVSSLTYSDLSVSGGYISMILAFPTQLLDQLDNCDLSASFVRHTSEPVAALSIQRLIATPTINAQSTTIISNQMAVLILNGARLPLLYDDWNVSVALQGPSCPSAPQIDSVLLDTGSRTIELQLIVPESADNCVLAAQVSRFGESSGFVPQALIVTRPQVSTSQLEVVSQRTKQYTFSGLYFPRSSDTWNITLTATNCSTPASLLCDSPTILAPGESILCTIYINSGVGCDVSAVVTRNAVSSAPSLVARIIRPRVYTFRTSLPTLPSDSQLTAIVQRVQALLNASPVNISVVAAPVRSIVADVSIEVPNTASLLLLQSNTTLQQELAALFVAGFDQAPVDQAPVDRAPVDRAPIDQNTNQPSPNGVSEASTSPSSIGTGAIVGIVIGAILLCVAIFAAVMFIILRKRTPTRRAPESEMATNKQSGQSESVSSASVTSEYVGSFESTTDAESESAESMSDGESPESASDSEDEESADFTSTSGETPQSESDSNDRKSIESSGDSDAGDETTSS